MPYERSNLPTLRRACCSIKRGNLPKLSEVSSLPARTTRTSHRYSRPGRCSSCDACRQSVCIADRHQFGSSEGERTVFASSGEVFRVRTVHPVLNGILCSRTSQSASGHRLGPTTSDSPKCLELYHNGFGTSNGLRGSIRRNFAACGRNHRVLDHRACAQCRLHCTLVKRFRFHSAPERFIAWWSRPFALLLKGSGLR